MPKKASNGNGTKRPRGRPPKPIDLKLVYELAKIQCTDEEIAAACSVGNSTISRRYQTDPEFRELINKGRQEGKQSLRRTLYKIANDQGHKSQLGAAIWLSKQYLGMAEKQEAKIEQHVTGEIDVKGLEGKPFADRLAMWDELVAGRGN